MWHPNSYILISSQTLYNGIVVVPLTLSLVSASVLYFHSITVHAECPEGIDFHSTLDMILILFPTYMYVMYTANCFV